MVHFHMRGETKPAERRTAVTPEDAKALIEAGHTVTVERFRDRCYPDSDYEKAGCKLMPAGAWEDTSKVPKDAIVLGLKELPEGDSKLPHSHIMFAHCFKNQDGWKDVMNRFIKGDGKLYDLEFLTDENGRRKVAFGKSAGFCGMACGILAWAQQGNSSYSDKMTVSVFPPDVYYPTRQDLIDHVQTAAATRGRQPRIIIIGALGRCGSGAVELATAAGVPKENITCWDMAETKKGGPFPEIVEHDIFVNCIYLDPKTKQEPFLTKELVDGKGRVCSVMVDVSCDPTNPANPVPVYNECTTFMKPVLRVVEPGKPEDKSKVVASRALGQEGFGHAAAKGASGIYRAETDDVAMDGGAGVFTYSPTAFEATDRPRLPFDVIAIDHLPSLVPRESSNEFSTGLTPMLTTMDKDPESIWKRALDIYESKKAEMAK